MTEYTISLKNALLVTAICIDLLTVKFALFNVARESRKARRMMRGAWQRKITYYKIIYVWSFILGQREIIIT